MRIDECIVAIETWPLRKPFRISRGAKSEAAVVVVELRSDGHVGRGECCPYPRYGETADAIHATLNSFDVSTLSGPDPAAMRQLLQQRLPAGSARNALDCALWDLEAKASGTPVWRIAGLKPPAPTVTCYTLSLATPAAMADEARNRSDCPLLKLKLGDIAADADRMRAVRDARPDARLVCDANEGWQAEDLGPLLAAAADCGLELIEQPLPAAGDAALADMVTAIPLCADEFAAPGGDVGMLANRYQAVNIKLDKTGGLTAALAMVGQAKRLGLKIMIGSMVSTSLSMAPAALLAASADWIDLDSPLLLAQDRPYAMRIENGMLSLPAPQLWG